MDIDPTAFNVDPAQIEAVMTVRTKAIMPVHLFVNDVGARLDLATPGVESEPIIGGEDGPRALRLAHWLVESGEQGCLILIG